MDLPPFSLDLFLSFASNPLALIALTVGVTEAAQKAWKWLDGPIVVPTFATTAGAILGGAAGAYELVTVPGFTGGWTGGLLYGALAGLSGVFGLNLIEAIGEHARANTQTLAPATSAGQWIVNHVTNLVPRSKLTPAIELVAPLLKQFVDAQLTPELQAELTVRIHKLLSGARLLPEHDFGGEKQ